MTGARAALEAARSAATLARSEPTEANRKAVLVALATVMRHDAAGAAANGQGYNPYRDKGGKFAPGAHKQREKTGEQRGGVVATPKPSARSALKEAKVAAARARQSPTAENVGAARAAMSRATKAAAEQTAAKASHAADHAGAEAHVAGVADDHSAAAAAHERAAAAHRDAGNHEKADEHSRQADEHRRAADVLGAPAQHQATPHDDAFAARDAIRGRLASGIKGDAQNARIDPETQAALRDANNRIMAAYGVTPRLTNTPDAHTVHTVTTDEMGGAYGQMWSEHTSRPGLMTISHEQAALLKEHMQLDRAGLHDLAQRAAAGHDDAYFKLFAAHTMHHETMHGHGPSIDMGMHRSTVEELTTEMSARRITADMHGVPSHGEAVNLAYDHIIDPIVAHAASAAGVSRERAYEAMEHASLSLKRSSGRMSDDEAISHVATKAAEHLGAEPAVAAKIATGIYQTSNKLRMGQ